VKVWVIISVFQGILDKVQVCTDPGKYLALWKAEDERLHIKRDPIDEGGGYDSKNDVWCEEVYIDAEPKKEPEPSGGKLFLATFYQQDGEFEYDDISFVHASCLDKAVEKCLERLRTWWDGEMKPVYGESDAYEEGEGGYRIVKLGGVVEVESMRDVIDRIGEIS